MTAPRPANAASCSCGAWWTGLTRAHCAACHTTFSTDNAADKHRQGRFGIDRRCVDPATAGLTPVTKPYGVLWQNPAPEDGRAWFTKPST
ncbi:FDXHR family putative zinc-binding protein [Streptomyces erythrochromogenes]|uniref:FDXHR family putative zinc-binding protein n=1 Tax=Streptomyces erythrochromogenes TaxID=285574 RepID=UPI0037D00145